MKNETRKEELSNGETSTYDSLVGKNESKFLSSIRYWEKKIGFRTPLLWTNIVIITMFHISAISWYITHLYYGTPIMWPTIIFGFLMDFAAGFGITAGVHRYWCHRSYEATKPLQLLMLIFYSMAGLNTVPSWVRDHRIHHKFSETSADPHDANRGFFFAHVGWLMMKKHPDVIREGRKIDMSDIANDPLITLHTRYFGLIKLIFCFILPTFVPIVCWGESWNNAVLSQVMLRYTLTLHFTWSVNSFAHLWGNKPYDKLIMPVENWGVSLVTFGEGWHNYHHTFPWDYKASEGKFFLDATTLFLDGFAKIGWAYGQKQASPELVRAVTNHKGPRN